MANYLLIGWALYGVFIAWMLYSAIRDRREAERYHRETEGLARCICGAVLSEWFVNHGCMWHPTGFGCGWISPWGSHEEYREELRRHDDIFREEVSNG